MIIILSILLIPILGMFYFMWLARNGSLILSEKSWHFRYLKWYWEIEKEEFKNACPYYWMLVFTLLLSPFYFIFKWIYISYKWCEKRVVIFYKKKNKKEKKKKTITITGKTYDMPENKKQLFTIVYEKSKDILVFILILLSIIIIALAVISIFIIPFIKMTLGWAIFTVVITAWILISIVLANQYPEYDEYHIEHYLNFAKGIFGIVSIPFLIIWKILTFIGRKIFKIYLNHCPPIKWDN